MRAMLFAEGKDWHGMRRFRLRRLWRVNREALMRAAGQNLKRLLKKRGWGRRPFPAEAMCVLFLLVGDSYCFGVSIYFLDDWIRLSYERAGGHSSFLMSFAHKFESELLAGTVLVGTFGAWGTSLLPQTSIYSSVFIPHGLFDGRVPKGDYCMFNFVTTVVAALIGSIIGSVGAVLTDHWLTARSEKFHRREILVQRYLFQLQDALEMLYYRLHNLAMRGGRSHMSDEYFETTTLYALGRVLALERIFALEAVYPQLDDIYPGLGKLLKEREYRVDLQLPTDLLYQYDRVALAEALIVHEGELFRASTFLEFRRRYEAANAPEKQWLAPASKAIQSLPADQMNQLLETIYKKAVTIAEKTDIDISLPMPK